MPDRELKDQFHEFCGALNSKIVRDGVHKFHKDNGETLKEKSVNLEILRLVCLREHGLYKQCKLMIHVQCRAALSYCVESTVESMISVYETRFHKKRNCMEESAEAEMEITINGPPNCMADGVIEMALNHYFDTNTKRKKWNFLRAKSIHELLTDPSLVYKKHNSKKPRFPMFSS